jgi:hypothetical protein
MRCGSRINFPITVCIAANVPASENGRQYIYLLIFQQVKNIPTTSLEEFILHFAIIFLFDLSFRILQRIPERSPQL